MASFPRDAVGVLKVGCIQAGRADAWTFLPRGLGQGCQQFSQVPFPPSPSLHHSITPFDSPYIECTKPVQWRTSDNFFIFRLSTLNPQLSTPLTDALAD